MFERFTEAANKSIEIAQAESRRLGYNFVGTEHILLGLIGEGGNAAQILTIRGLHLLDARAEVEKLVDRGSGFIAVEIPFSIRGKRALELSWEEAQALGHNHIGTEHMLLGLIRLEDGLAVRTLRNFGVNLTDVREDVLRLIQENRTRALERPAAFEKLLPRVLEVARLANPGEAGALLIDARSAVEKSTALENAKVYLSDDNVDLVRVQANAAASLVSIQALTEELKRIWQDIQYNHFEAATVTWYKDALLMRFVTVISSESWSTTGRIVVDGQHYEELATQFETRLEKKLRPLRTEFK